MKKPADFFKRLTSYKLFLPIICLIAVLVLNLIQTPAFFEITLKNGGLYGYIIDIFNRGSGLIIMAVGMTLVIASSAGTDISVGAVSALAGSICVAALGTGAAYQMPYALAVLMALLAGVACGAFNGFLVASMRIQAMVATLILFTAGRGIAQIATGSFVLYVKPADFQYLGNFIPGMPIPTPCIVAACIVLITYLALKKTPLNMFVQSVGINAKASRLVGLNAVRIQFMTYVVCGLLAAVAGLISVSRTGSADANNIGLNTELDAILAVTIGGNSLMGGKFSLAGSVIGAITIQALTTTLYAMHIKADQIPLFKAIMVIIIVALQSQGLQRWFRNLRAKSSEKAVLKEADKNA